MNKFILISLMCLAFQMQSQASHILGAEITYQHVKDYKYKAFVTVYRDCNECKIAGQGGGSNTKDCGQFYLYLKSSTRNGCTAKSLGQFNLTRESIRTILPLCPTATSKCDGDSGLNYGVEAHTFSTEIDFDNYKNYENCGFDMYVQLSARADDIDNLAQSSLGETLYNYSYIDPFEKHSSPQFSETPEILFTVNQASRSLIMREVSGDSVSIHFAKPLRGANKVIDFQSGYFLNRPLSVWCNGDVVQCEANPNANPPVGVTLNPLTGYLAFTPVKNNEKASIVFEVEKYKKTNTGMHLISVVRRDILIEVTSIGQYNNPPQLFGTSIDKTSNEITACAGTELCFDIQAQDAPYLFPDGSYQSANTISYSWLSQLPNAEIKQVSIAQAPYKKLQVCWTPSAANIGQRYMLDVKATDDNCPIQASTSGKYFVNVRDIPSNSIKLSELWCGSLQLEADSNGSGSDLDVKWNLVDAEGTVNFESERKVDTLQFNQPFRGILSTTLTDVYGCMRKIATPIDRNQNDLTRPFGDLLGQTTYCAGDSARFNLKQSNGVVFDKVTWVHNRDTVSSSNTYSFLAAYQETTDTVRLYLSGLKGRLSCRNTIEREIKVDKGLDVALPTINPVCEGTAGIDLEGLPSIAGGKWFGINHNILDGTILKIQNLGKVNVATEVCQEYVTKSIVSGCESRDTLCLYVVPNPKLNLNKTTICGASGYFNLINMDPSLFSFGSYDIEWKIDGVIKLDQPQGNKHLVDLTRLTKGDHQIIGVYTSEFGCTTSDTSMLSLVDDVDLSHVMDKKICQGDRTNLNRVFDINLGGGLWSSPQNPEAVLGNTVSIDACGPLDLLFTYDQFGCYVNHEVKLDVVCRPEVSFGQYDTICALQSEIQLKANPSTGVFVGDHIEQEVLNIVDDNKTYNFNYMLEKDICVFNYPQSITVVPAPTMFIGSGIPDALCEGQKIELNPIQVTNGKLKIYHLFGDTAFTGEANEFSHKPSSQEIADKAVRLELELVGAGYCPTKKEAYKVKLHPKAKITLLDSQFSGCAPYAFKPAYYIDAESVDWSKTSAEWDFGTGKPSYKIQPSTTYKVPGIYSVSIHTVSPAGCVFNQTWLNAIQVHETPSASFSSSPSANVSVANPIVKFHNNSIANDSVLYVWDFGTGNPADMSHEVSPVFDFGIDTGRYKVSLTATTLNGCDDTYTDVINVLPDIQLFVPTAFSPNGKGSEVTEEFKVVGTNISRYHIEIFNRWGEQVYASDDIQEEWDGKAGGRYCEIGIYAYLIQATSTSGKTYELKGTINVIR